MPYLSCQTLTQDEQRAVLRAIAGHPRDHAWATSSRRTVSPSFSMLRLGILHGFSGTRPRNPYPTGTCEQRGSPRAVRKETSRRVSSSHSVSGRLRRLRQNPSVGESWKAATLVWARSRW